MYLNFIKKKSESEELLNIKGI